MYPVQMYHLLIAPAQLRVAALLLLLSPPQMSLCLLFITQLVLKSKRQSQAAMAYCLLVITQLVLGQKRYKQVAG